MTPARDTDSLSSRFLDTCCFLARQLHIARKPWINESSSRSHTWSCPSVLQLATLPNTWAITTDLCGHGDKWRKRTRLPTGWIDSRDLHRFAKTSIHSKRWQLFLVAFEALCALPTHSVFHVPCALCRRFGCRALHQCQKTALIRESGLGDVVWRAVCSRSLELRVRRWTPHEPSCFSPCQASCSRQLFIFCLPQQKNFLRHR